MVQAPAPARLIEGGLPTDATVAQVLVSKCADYLPLYRQAHISARQGVAINRSTLADWVGRAALLLEPVHGRLLDHLEASTKLFADETTAPVLDPGRGRTKNGVDPQSYLADLITRIVGGHPQSRLNELLPWAYPILPGLKAVA